MLITVRHTTRYIYDTPVRYTVQSLRLTPVSFRGHRVASWSVRVAGAKSSLQFTDGFGNLVDLVTMHTPHRELVVEASGTVETNDCNGIVTDLPKSAPVRVFLRETAQTRADERIRALAHAVKEKEPLDQLHTLARLVRERIAYVPGFTDAHTGAAEALSDGKGVCQDHAHVFVSAARTLAVPARYVTGYLLIEGENEANAHHAWAEAWVDSLGWVGFDVANGICTTDRYVRLAGGLDASYAAPIVGSRRGEGGEQLKVSVAVQQQVAQQ
jgi:transglutaminase-like putative cysteine protease